MHARVWSRIAAAVVISLVMQTGEAALAQEEVLFSVSGQVTVPDFSGGDADLMEHGAGSAARPLITAQGLEFLLGDLDGNGVADDLADVDAVSLWPTRFPGAEGLLISLISDRTGIKDGDLVRFSASPGSGSGGLEVVIAEADLVSAIGAVDGNVDLDAAHFDPDSGSLIFSLAEDEVTTSLSGSTPGMVRDDEILFLEGTGSPATVLYDADAVSLAVASALGVDPFDVKDVLSVTLGATGDVWFTVQSPSADDATVFSMADGGTIVSGHREEQFGFDNNAEIDALARLDSTPAFCCVRSDPERPAVGGTVRMESWRGSPGGGFQVLIAASIIDPTNFRLPGFGGLYLDPSDGLFLACLQAAPFFGARFDSSGHGLLELPAPPDGNPIDIAVQVLDLSAFTISHPIWLEVNQ